MRRIRTGLVATALVLLGLPAHGRSKGGVTLPDKLTVAGKVLVLNGMGVREATWMKVDVYVAGLYLERPSKNPAAILAAPPQVMKIHMQFVRDVSRGDVTGGLQKGMEKNVSADLRARLKDRIARMISWLTPLDEGQSMSFTFVPGKGTEVFVKGQRKGTIEGDDFGPALFSVWLGPSPPNGGLKDGLLGK